MEPTRFTQLVVEREEKLYRISRTLLVSAADREDAIQETLLRAWLHIDSVRDEWYFDTWLIRILINECRRVGKRKIRPVPVTDDPPPPNPALYEALAALHENYRLVVEMHYLEGYSVDELARILRIPGGTVKWRLSQGRKLLRQLLNEEADEA